MSVSRSISFKMSYSRVLSLPHDLFEHVCTHTRFSRRKCLQDSIKLGELVCVRLMVAVCARDHLLVSFN